jgi:hypothetical protein
MYSQYQSFNVVLKWINRTLLKLFLLTLSVPVFAETMEAAAFIEKMNGPTSIFMVLRGEEKITSVTPLTTLQDGDWVLVRKRESTYLDDSRNYTKLTFGDDKYEFVTYKNSPYLVKKRGKRVALE